jgi:hypothetical protein
MIQTFGREAKLAPVLLGFANDLKACHHHL